MKTSRIILLVNLMLLLSACQTVAVNSDPEKAAKLNASLGVAYMQKGQNELAMEKLNKALEQDSSNADVHHYLAELYRRLNVSDKAEQYFLSAMELSPGDSAIKNNYAAFLCQQGTVDAAYKIFEAVLADPLYVNKGRVLENKAFCAQLTGNIKLAHENFVLATKFNPRLTRSLLALAQIEFDEQNIDEAYKYFTRFTQNSKHTPQSLWLGILLEKQRGNKNRVASFSTLLRGMYPDSKEAQLLQKLKKRGVL